MPIDCSALPTRRYLGLLPVLAHIPAPEPNVVPVPPSPHPITPPPPTPPEIQDPVLPGEIEPVRDPVPPGAAPLH